MEDLTGVNLPKDDEIESDTPRRNKTEEPEEMANWTAQKTIRPTTTTTP
jgi:hypothetical protein